MLIKQVTFRNYKRFPLLQASEVVFTFDKKLNLIIGTNGCGKSSLVKELSPLPSQKEDFYPNGYKEIHIEHNNKDYILISDFTNNETSYSFIVDNEELNNSHNVTTQKILVQKHFSLTQDIYDILIGVQTFTSMTVVQRKKLFNQISGTNITDLISLYDDTAAQEKTQQSILKNTSSLILSEKQKVLNEKDKETLEAQYQKNTFYIEKLLSIHESLKSVTAEDFSIEETQELYINKLNQYLSYLKQNYIIATNQYDIDETYAYNVYKSNISQISELIDASKNKLLQYNTKIEAIEKVSQSSQEELYAKQTKLQKQLDSYKQSIPTLHDSRVVYELKTYLTNTLQGFIDIFNSIKPPYYTKHNYDATRALIESIDKRIKDIDFEINQLQGRKKHLLEHIHDPLTTCPKCNYQWNINYDETKVQKIDETINTLNKQVSKLTEELKNYEKDEKQLIENYNLIKSYLQLKKPLEPYFSSYILEIQDKLKTNPIDAVYVIERINQELVLLESYYKVEEELNEVNRNIKLLESSTENNLSELKALYNQELELYNSYIQKRQEEQENYKQLQDSRAIWLKLKNYREDMLQNLSHLKENISSYFFREIRKHIESELMRLNLANIEIKNKLNVNDSVIAVIEQYEKNIEELMSKLQVYDAILDVIDPKSGLIGKFIATFINNFINAINESIEQIWSYSFKVVPYDIEADEKFDYRFKVMVQDKVISSDITKTSSGMREIIDLAFKMGLMKYLNLHDYPLYLDEFGIRLDEQHRSKIYNIVFNFISSDDYSQIFMITHTDTSFSNVKNTELYVLDDLNIRHKDKTEKMRISYA
jgi:DNA repair exonuclease SbcCD ATPase subunit